MKKTCWLKANIEIQIFIIKKDGQSAIFLLFSFLFSGFIFCRASRMVTPTEASIIQTSATV